MSWVLILALADLGLLMGVASVFGLTRGIEGALWLVIGIACSVVLGRKAPSRHFLHGFLVGLIGGALSPLVQATLFPTYAANNPEAMEQMAAIPGGVSPRLFFALLSPVIGLLSGLLLGALSWIAARVLGKRSSEVTPA